MKLLSSRSCLGAAFLVGLLGIFHLPAPMAEEQASPGAVIFEQFDSMARWEPLTFPKIPRHSIYSVEKMPDGGSCLRAESDGTASGLLYKGTFDVYSHPNARWRWKVSNVYEKGDVRRKDGDDYPLRIYILFDYNTKDPAVKTSLKYSLARILYGKYPPYATLNYIWANRTEETEIVPNPYTERAMMIPLRSGPSSVGQWMSEEVDVLSDYRRAFGTDPPRTAGLALMNDSDNTGEKSVGWIDWIGVYGKTADPAEAGPGKGQEEGEGPGRE